MLSPLLAIEKVAWVLVCLAIFYLWEMEQIISITRCFKNEVKYNTILEMLYVAFGKSSINKTSVYKWYKCFQEGCEYVEDDERPGYSSTSTLDENIEKVKKMIMDCW